MFESCKLVLCWVNKHSTLKIIVITNISKIVQYDKYEDAV